MKNFVSEPWKRDGYPSRGEYLWDRYRDVLLEWFGDITNPNFPKAVYLVEWAISNGKFSDEEKQTYEKVYIDILSQFKTEEELENYLEKIHGKVTLY